MSLTQLTQKDLCTVSPSEKISQAARMMCDRSVGALVITDESGETPLGIVTDRDIVWMIAEGLDPKEAEVGQFAQAELQTVCVNDSLSDVTHKMRESGVRRLPIVDTERRLIGLVSLDDVLVLLGREMSDAAATISGEIEHERHIGEAIRKAKR